MRFFIFSSCAVLIALLAYEYYAVREPSSEIAESTSVASVQPGQEEQTHRVEALVVKGAEPGDQAFRTLCEKQLPPTEIEVTARPAPITEVNNEDIRYLTGQQQSFSRGTFTLGLTSEAYSLNVSTRLNLLQMPGGGVACVRPALTFTLTEPYHKVSIAREFAPGTCIFNEVRAHEYRHVAVHQQSLGWARDIIEQELRAQFGNNVYYGAPAQLQHDIQDAVNSYWLPRVQQLHAEVEKRQGEIDTHEEYERLSNVCEGAAKQIIAESPDLADLR